MAVIKCKMCGGDLNLIEGASTAECVFCGSIQTIPKVDDEKKMTLFARANRLRAACEFDKAAGIYESIVADFPEEAEAYWGLVLCKYGIEYVDDPATGKKIPTCHRSSFESIMEDSDFEQAMENADAVARKVYREEAKQIEETRKGIIAVSANEEPYDIFICYKETDENGDRTLDSVLAQDIYDALTDRGYRTFFARITLEDKLGMEYEPYIFAALNSAKIMLAVGTDYEYYNAVWVKNEWSRFLKLITKDRTKHLFPCYKNLSPYDIPKEFQHLQGQDMGKIGAMQDLLRGVEKILPRTVRGQTETPKQSYNVYADAPRNSKIKPESVQPAKQFDINKNDHKLSPNHHQQAVATQEKQPIKAEANATANRQKQLEKRKRTQNLIKMIPIAIAIIVTIASTVIFVVPMQRYSKAQSLLAEERFEEALLIFEELGEYKDSVQLVEQLTDQIAELNYQIAEKAQQEGKIGIAAVYFGKCADYKDARTRSDACWDQIAVRKTVETGVYYVIALQPDGTAQYISEPVFAGKVDISAWSDLVAVSGNGDYCVGLRRDGTVVCEPRNAVVESWTDIVAIDAGHPGIAALRRDGTVCIYGLDNYDAEISTWKDIVAISFGSFDLFGLKADGTIASYADWYDTSDWRDITQIAAGAQHIVGLRSNGTVVAESDGNLYLGLDVQNWTDIQSIAAGEGVSYGVRKDGTVVSTISRNDPYYAWLKEAISWKNVADISADYIVVACSHKDGSVSACGYPNADGTGSFDTTKLFVNSPTNDTNDPNDPHETVELDPEIVDLIQNFDMSNQDVIDELTYLRDYLPQLTAAELEQLLPGEWLEKCKWASGIRLEIVLTTGGFGVDKQQAKFGRTWHTIDHEPFFDALAYGDLTFSETGEVLGSTGAVYEVRELAEDVYVLYYHQEYNYEEYTPGQAALLMIREDSPYAGCLDDQKWDHEYEEPVYKFAEAWIITVSSKIHADQVLNDWLAAGGGEENFISLVNHNIPETYALDTLTLYSVVPGQFVEEMDSWCFDPQRRPGDAAVIETEYGYSICYITAVTPKMSDWQN